MEIEEPQQTRLIFSLSNGETIQVNRDLLSSFTTLENMIADLPSENKELIIPLPEFITKPLLQWAIDVAIIYRVKGTTIHSFDDLYEDVALYNALFRLRTTEPPFLTLFGVERIPDDKEDLTLLFELIGVLNWLGMQIFVVFAVDKVYQILNQLATDEIESLMTHKKRKRAEQKALIITLPLTVHYQREQVIHDFLLESLPHELVKAKILTRKYVNPIAFGNGHILMVRPDGLYGYGSNTSGQLGLGKISHKERLTKIVIPGTPLIVAAAEAHSFCWTTMGFYGCGSYNYGQLGLGNKKDKLLTWTPIQIEGKMLQIVASSVLTLILTTTGLYATGENSNGELGLDDLTDRTVFTKVKVPGEVLDIAVSRMATFVLTTQGLYGCGRNDYLTHYILLSLITSTVTGLTRLNIENSDKIREISAGYFHAIILTENELITAGDNEYGQRGVGDFDNHAKPIIVTIPEETIKSVYCGPLATFVVTVKGNLYATGRNKQEGALGIGNAININTFTLCIGLEGKILSITNSGSYTLVLTTQGLYYAGYIGSPFEKAYLPASIDRFKFTKTSINMGYVSEPLLLEEPRKQRRLQCWQCSGKAKFMSQSNDLMPFCSKYCLYKSLEK